MKAGKAQNENSELRIWCEGCCIRIAPHEGRTVFQGKTYHLHCYSKLSTKSKAEIQARRRLKTSKDSLHVVIG